MNKERYELRTYKNGITTTIKSGKRESCIEEYEASKKESPHWHCTREWLLVKITETVEVMG